MTEDRTQETPGPSEVSAKFADEAPVPASVTKPEDPVVLLGRRWDEVMTQRGHLKNRDDDDPKHPDVIEDERLHDVQLDIEDSIADTPTHTAAGIVAKLLQLRRNETEFDGDAPWRPAAFRTALDALGRGTMPTIEDPVLALKRGWEARYKALDEQRDDPNADDSDEAVQPFYDRLHETEVQILRTQATTPAGVAIKLILWARLHCDADEVSGLNWTRKSIKGELFDLDRLPVLSALLDLERMSQGIAPSTTEEPEIDNKGVTTRGLDPVAQIGRDLTTIWRQVWQNEEELSSAEAHSPEKTRLENLESHLSDRRDALEAMAAEVQAGSLEGVMVQIMLAHAEADVMAASTEESNERQMRTVSKLLYSALAALERLAGVPREKLGGEAYLTRALDPRALVAEVEHLATADKSEA